ncbi:plasmid stabilization protein [Patescibacteria group bacterium]|nr:plasmid stabilization protein [Patescibacteria group bacterium]MBU4210733.1 plasmid stabilization protein [Patescibacteria group bacterium]MBU4265323.1 plasmid stabilization protein [Patescibacteria group bacterium]MBU4390306.1 plasmid stabilization protein [Patescibacteria group bacterium]MBU4397588.1 plasmid stabilization protein [Patescibacteria group bacterium]
MNFEFTHSFKKEAKKLCKQNQQLKSKLAKQFKLFGINPNHPSLKLHKLQGKRSVQYAIWIKGNLRALCIKKNNIYIFFDLITHNQY